MYPAVEIDHIASQKNIRDPVLCRRITMPAVLGGMTSRYFADAFSRVCCHHGIARPQAADRRASVAAEQPRISNDG